jgi:hypothetical protein
MIANGKLLTFINTGFVKLDVVKLSLNVNLMWLSEQKKKLSGVCNRKTCKITQVHDDVQEECDFACGLNHPQIGPGLSTILSL